MHIKITIENKFINLCNIDTRLDESGKKAIRESWKRVSRFLDNSHYDGKANLIVSTSIDDFVIFDKVKMRMKQEHYQDVFELVEHFIYDKIHFFNKLEEEEKIDSYRTQHKRNLKALELIRKARKELIHE